MQTVKDSTYTGWIGDKPTSEDGLALFRWCDHLRSGGAFNTVRIAEVLLERVEGCAAP